jgi:membrane-associated phospholipid phosphatase
MRCRYARVATGDPAVMRDGRTSYPSGHAAETFMAFGLLSVYLMAKLKLFTQQSQVGTIDSGTSKSTLDWRKFSAASIQETIEALT